MRYLGIDVHVTTSVWCLVDAEGAVLERGKVATTAPKLTALVQRLGEDDEFLAGQEVGKLSYFVHDTLTAAGVKLLSFNAHHLRMISSSRKKTDQRDSYWIARALQSGMMPTRSTFPPEKCDCFEVCFRNAKHSSSSAGVGSRGRVRTCRLPATRRGWSGRCLV